VLDELHREDDEENQYDSDGSQILNGNIFGELEPLGA
jgi:hypothetical protein